MWGSVGGSVLGPHTQTHFLTSPPFLFPHPSPTSQHASPLTPYTLLHPRPHIFPYLPPHPNTLPNTSPHIPHTSYHCSPHLPLHISPLTPCTLPHLSPHLPPQFGLVAKLPCEDVTLINSTVLWKSPIKLFTTTRNLKSWFGVYIFDV